MAKVSKFSKQVLAKQQQIEKIVKSIIPDARLVSLGTSCLHSGHDVQLTVHVFIDMNIVASVHEWDDTIDNRQKIRDSYNEYLASQ